MGTVRGGCSHSGTRSEAPVHMFEELFVVIVERKAHRLPDFASAPEPISPGAAFLSPCRLCTKPCPPFAQMPAVDNPELLHATCFTAHRGAEAQNQCALLTPAPTPSPPVHWGDGGRCIACAVRAATPTFLVTRNVSIT